MPRKITNPAHAREARQILRNPQAHGASLCALARYVLGLSASNPYAGAKA
ncbi:MAG: hypothetical protein COB08_005605 [Rhodobacteraceae bacterium]|nr:hypothetical protein [Paracoccaceae bacterium]